MLSEHKYHYNLQGGIDMDRKTITIQTNTRKKRKLDQRLFTCQVFEHGNQRFYSLDDTKRDLGLKRFSLDEGCRVFDNGICYPIQRIYYTERPARPFIMVNLDFTI